MERQQRRNDLPRSSSTTLNDLLDDQRVMHPKINKIIEKMEKINLMSPIVSSEDDDEMN